MANPKDETPEQKAVQREPEAAPYDPPRVEAAMSAEEVEREALYAGRTS